jgi:predicted ArsR family transcriptional regulator
MPTGSGKVALVSTRRELLDLLRSKPGSTVNELATALSLTVVGVRRHLDKLAADGIVEQVRVPNPHKAGRPPAGWRLSAAGKELFPRRYDVLALDLLEDLAEEAGPEVVDAVLARRTEKLAAEYEAQLDGVSDPQERVLKVAALRDKAGYVTECKAGNDGDVLLVENNCAIHRVAEHHPAVCTMELSLLRQVLGPDVEVTRLAHTMAGDAVCSYCIRPRTVDVDGTVTPD